MEEAQARRKEGDDGGSAMFGRVERRGGARFVVVFQESHETVLIIEAGEEVLAHRAGVAVAQSVQEPLVVAVVEALLLQRPFEIPIDFGHMKTKSAACSRTRGIARGQKGCDSMSHVRRKTSGSTSIAMSQRTPSHWPGMRESSPIIASRSAGLP